MKRERDIFMIKPGDLPTTKKTIHELAKEFPEKTYRQLEIYRDADRNEEAQRIFTQQENEQLKEDQLTESQKSQKELEPIEEESWKEKYEKEHKLRQEAEGELTIVKTISVHSSPEMRKAKKEIERLNTLLNPLRKARESGL